MLTYKLNWIKNIQVKSSKNASNKMGQNLQKNSSTKMHLSTLLKYVEKIWKKIHAYRGWKFVATVQISAHSESPNRNEKSYHAQIRAGIKSPNTISNFFNPKWVKFGTLLKIPEIKLKTKSLVTTRGHKENQK